MKWIKENMFEIAMLWFLVSITALFIYFLK